MGLVFERLAQSLARRSDDHKSHFLVLAVAYSIYKTKKLRWLEVEFKDNPKSTSDEIDKSIERFHSHQTTDEELDKIIDMSTALIHRYMEASFDVFTKERKDSLTKELLGELTVESKNAIIEEIKDRTSTKEAYKINIVSSIAGPVIIVIAVFIAGFAFPGMSQWFEAGTWLRKMTETAHQPKQEVLTEPKQAVKKKLASKKQNKIDNKQSATTVSKNEFSNDTQR